MASRSDYRRRERSWEREDRDRDRDRDRYHKSGRGREDGRKRSSRSRSPRRSDRDRRDYRREKGEKDHRRKEDGRDRNYDREREHKRDHDERRTSSRREDRKRHEDHHTRDPVLLDDSTPAQPTNDDPQPNPDERVAVEEGEEMDAVNDDDAAMASIMGMNGFGSTKGKQVVGNQEGAVNIKKIRTWRQYMNRRGGFNRPLDKIK